MERPANISGIPIAQLPKKPKGFGWAALIGARDRGVPNGTARGWHHFEASPAGIIVCRSCAKKALK
jgi:hypothetical protein